MKQRNRRIKLDGQMKQQKQQPAEVGLSEQLDTLMLHSQYAAAIKLLRRNAGEAKKDWHLIWNWGWCYFQLEQYQTAKVHFRRVTRLAPDHMLGYWAYGVTCYKTQNYRAAEIALRKALTLKDNYLARFVLATTYLLAGKIDKAEQVHLEGIALKPDSPKRHHAYADFLYDVGRKKEERQERKKARELTRLQKQVSS